MRPRGGRRRRRRRRRGVVIDKAVTGADLCRRQQVRTHVLRHAVSAVTKGELQVGDWLSGDHGNQAVSVGYAHAHGHHVRVVSVFWACGGNRYNEYLSCKTCG